MDNVQKLTCKIEMNKGIDNCLRQQFDKNFMKEFGCLYPMFSAKSDKSKFCNISQLTMEQRTDFLKLFKGIKTKAIKL